MAVGIIGSIGTIKKDVYKDTDVTLVPESGGVDKWVSYSTAGANCYIYDLKFTDIPNSGITSTSDISIIPSGTITQTLIENFAQINAVEVTVDSNSNNVVRFYAFNGKPTVSIDVTLRVMNG